MTTKDFGLKTCYGVTLVLRCCPLLRITAKVCCILLMGKVLEDRAWMESVGCSGSYELWGCYCILHF